MGILMKHRISKHINWCAGISPDDVSDRWDNPYVWLGLWFLTVLACDLLKWIYLRPLVTTTKFNQGFFPVSEAVNVSSNEQDKSKD